MAKELLPDALCADRAAAPSAPAGAAEAEERTAPGVGPGGSGLRLLAQPLPAPEDPLRAPG
jgi:hypothetical protein